MNSSLEHKLSFSLLDYFQTIRQIFFVAELNQEGGVEEILYEERSYLYNFQVVVGKNIRELYFIPETASLSGLACDENETHFFNAATAFPSRNAYEKFEDLFGIYSTIPNTYLQLRKMGGQKIMAVVMYPACFSNLLFFKQEPVIILDEKGVIQGFNHKFRRFFSNSQLTGNELLLKPVEDYLSPSPLSLIRPPGEGPLTIVNEPWNPLDSFSPPLQDVRDSVFLPEHTDLSLKDGRLCWRPSRADRTNLLPLRKALNTRLWDVRIDMTFEVASGGPPSAILFGSEYDRFL